MYDIVKDFKNEFKINTISGLMMLHYFKWPWCLEDLTNYVDDIYLLLHYSPGFRAEWPKHIPKIQNSMIVETNNDWDVMEWRDNQGHFREKLLRALDIISPNLVFFPDEDEAFPEPEFLVKDLRRFYKSKKQQLAFKRCNFWDSMDTVRKDRWIYYGPHVKIYKWNLGLSYMPYIGFNRVTMYGRKNMLAKTVMKHYAYMDRAERERRYYILYKEKQKTFKNLLKEPKLIKYSNARNAPRT